MKLSTLCTLLLVLAMCCIESHAAPITEGPARTLQSEEVNLKPDQRACQSQQLANFYVAPGFGCFLEAPGCSGKWALSDASKVQAIQRPNLTITHFRCTWSNDALGVVPEETLQSLTNKTAQFACRYFSAGGTYVFQKEDLALQTVFEGTAKVSRLPGTGDLTISCRVNPGTDKEIGTVREVISMTVGCLNGDSIVNTPTGPRQVKHISVGDKVLAKDPTTGALVYDDVVFTPHKDAASLTLYQDIKASVPANQESRQLQVTASHYVPVGKDGKESKLAKDVQVGDIISVVVDNTTTTAIVESSNPTPLNGYYGIWTGTGSIVVDGVVATAHAEWPVVDNLLNKLPGGPVQKHHMLQAPMRMLYKTAGPNIVKFVSNMVNALDAARPFTVGGAVAAYALAGANSEATVKP